MTGEKHTMREIDLRQMQQIELNLLIEFDKVCKANSLRYYLDGGTLLGAMCYEGFIPWDDDIDIKMPRRDYEKLLSMQSAFPPYITIDAPRREHCEYLFTKLVDNRTVLIEEHNGVRKTSGVYIDILPMDGQQEDPNERSTHIRKLQRLNSLFHESLSGFGSMKRAASIKTRIKGYLYALVYSPWRLYQKLTATASMCDYETSSQVGLVIEGNPDKERFLKSWLEPPVELEFEECLFPAPNEYKKHMVIFYGEHVAKPECYHNLPQYPSNHRHEVYWKK